MIWNKFRTSKPTAGFAPSRRAFLGGLGTVVTLPFLESLAPTARAAVGTSPVRLIWWSLPNGIVMDHFRPGADGPLTGPLPRILAPLESRRDDLLVLSGLANVAAIVPVAGDHARGTGSFLTCTTVEHSSDQISNGISVDQVAADAIGSATAFRSLELGTTGGSGVGDCDSGYSCAYTQNISWRDATTPNPKLVDPGLVFDRLFAGFDATETQEEIDRRLRWRTSVLDTVLDEANTLSPRLSTSDRAKLDEYMTGIRELETRLNGQTEGVQCVPGERPSSGLDYPSTVRAMSDLTVLALQCDLTRIVTFMMENAASSRSFDFIGVSGSHHEISHHQGDSSKLESLAQIDEWEMGELAYLLDRLEATIEVDGSDLLSNCLVLCSSEISDGDRHNHDNLPVVLAGQGGGYVATGRHKTLPDDEPIANLYIAMLEAAGVSVPSFGADGTRPLDLS